MKSVRWLGWAHTDRYQAADTEKVWRPGVVHEVSDELAERLLALPGFELADNPPPVSEPEPAPVVVAPKPTRKKRGG